ncbi:TadG family pilus assembly protein [Roseimaritima sediminicola]|uniref:TadG family pilus assembly protein n=1 Tax=Roseimaritima sediminicola TaxID=2662066 RepID=UPI0013866CE8|nr:TadG family pilus assembly protein [Roseimaritima sediminicola]
MRRGSVAVLGVFAIAVIVILLGMTVDLRHIHNGQEELNRSCDAAALAGCWELFDAQTRGLDEQYTEEASLQEAQRFSLANDVGGSGLQLASSDFVLGRYDYYDRTFSTDSDKPHNAVRVFLRRHAESNGELPLYFGQVLGRASQPLEATSTAAMLQSIEGFHDLDDGETLDILPFALDLETWLAVLAGQTEDKFRYSDGVRSGSNGLHECNLYPQGTGSPGNRGTVDIGAANNSTRDLSRQILHGISKQDLIDLNKPLKLDANGELLLNGDTGISAGVKDELAAIIGQKRVIPIFSQVTGNGNNAMYTIVRFAGVRILDVKLTGRMSQKRVIIEPAPMMVRRARVASSESAASDFLYTPVMLVN